jgi:two-component system, LytTR family, sensor histidine kinase AlgZ
MHPLLNHWRRFLLYLAAWIELGVILGVLAPASGHIRRFEAVAIMVPMMLLLGLVCLAPYYVCRAIPLRVVAWRRLIQHHLIGTILAATGVMLVGRLLAGVLSSVWPGLDQLFAHATPILTVFVALTFMLSTALHYAFLEIESSRRAQLLAREAQLRALKAQINPHFLFNSLNSISALTSIEPARAREMCIGLADFLRASLRLGERDTVPFAEEMALTNMYLGVEQARFGKRLRLIRDIDPACDACEVPALLIQPLVENAVKHGIAMMAEGGEIHISGHRDRELLRFCVSNPFDPEAPVQDRNGIGLRNVRARLEARYGAAAKMLIEATETNYQVTLTFPARRTEAP